MTATCDSFLQGIRIRATRLDECGEPDAGECGYVVSSGFINVALSENVTNPTEISQVRADGTRCYYIETPPLLNNIQANIEFCEVDPELFEIMTGSPLVLDDEVAPVAHGFTTDEDSFAVANVALEVWTNLARGGCPVGTGRRWGYYLMPWLYQGRVGKPTIENGAINFSIVEAKTRSGTPWGVGPYNIQLDNADAPAPLFEPLPSTTHDLLYKVNLAPPAASCGCQTLVPVS
jgi:hypothetical protein